MTRAKGTVASNSASLVVAPQRAKAVSTYTVTLRNSRRNLLFRSTARARSPQEALSHTDAAYREFVTAIAESRDLTRDTDALTSDAAQTLLVRSRAREGYQISDFVRCAGEWRGHDPDRRLTEAKVIELLSEVGEADRDIHAVLHAGETIDLCPSHLRSFKTGLITSDCTFRARDVTGRLRALSPACPALRMAVLLIVLRQLSGYQFDLRRQLAQRWSMGSIELPPSATLRAARRLQGPRRPDALIAWLHAHGHDAVADALAEGA